MKRVIQRYTSGKTFFKHYWEALVRRFTKKMGILDRVFCDKAFAMSANPKYDGFQKVLTLMVDKLFIKKYNGNGATRMSTAIRSTW